MEPGEKISDIEIAKYFNVSKTPVREAFQLLEFYKFIKVFPKKGTCVTKRNTENLEQIYALMINLLKRRWKNRKKKS